MYNIKYRKVLTSCKMRISRANQGRLEERGSGQAMLIHASAAPLWSTIARTPRSRLQDLDMRIQGYQKATRRVHMIKPVGMLRQSHVYMIKWCGSDIQVQEITSNIKKIKGMTVNLKSSKYMDIDNSESEIITENGVESLSTNKHAINTLNMR